MGVDAIAKRYFPLVVCTLLAVVALFQARGIGALVGGQLQAANAAPAKAHPHAPTSPLARVKRATALPILARNAFDSKTGPLDKIAPPPPPEPTEPVSTEPDANAEDPACPSGSVVLIADSEDPAWSFAMIRTSAGAKMRRVGDEVDGQVVKAITWDRVWLASGTGRCQLKLDIAAGKTASTDRPPPAATTTPSAKPGAGPKEGDVDPGAVRKISENEYVVSRSVVDKASGFAAELKKGARMVPGKGIRIGKVAPNSLLGQLSVTGGDIVRTINGFDMTDLDKTAEGYSRLKSAREVTLGLERNGSPVTITVKIE